MLKIDGSVGEGGGQVLRTSLALAVLTGQPFTIENIRGKRKKPGLLRQHLTGVRAAARISNAHVEGDDALELTDRHFAQQSSFGELIECIVDRGKRHIGPGGLSLRMELFRGHMTVALPE